MVGNVALLAEGIANALDVPHGASSQRQAIAQGIADAVSAYLETVVVEGTTSGGVCPKTLSTHVPLIVGGSLK